MTRLCSSNYKGFHIEACLNKGQIVYFVYIPNCLGVLDKHPMPFKSPKVAKNTIDMSLSMHSPDKDLLKKMRQLFGNVSK